MSSYSEEEDGSYSDRYNDQDEGSYYDDDDDNSYYEVEDENEDDYSYEEPDPQSDPSSYMEGGESENYDDSRSWGEPSPPPSQRPVSGGSSKKRREKPASMKAASNQNLSKRSTRSFHSSMNESFLSDEEQSVYYHQYGQGQSQQWGANYGGFANRLRIKEEGREPNKDTRLICGICMCVFLLMCVGVGVAAVFIERGVVDVFDPDSTLNGNNGNNTRSPFATSFTTKPPTQSPAPSIRPTGMPFTTPPTGSPTKAPTPTDFPTWQPTPSAPTSQAPTISVLPATSELSATADTTLRQDGSASPGTQDFLLVRQQESSNNNNNVMVMQFDLTELPLTVEQIRARRQGQVPSGGLDMSRLQVTLRLIQVVGSATGRPAAQLRVGKLAPTPGFPWSVEGSSTYANTFPNNNRPQGYIEGPSFFVPPTTQIVQIPVTGLFLSEPLNNQDNEKRLTLIVESVNNPDGVLFRSREYQFGVFAPQLILVYNAANVLPTPAPTVQPPTPLPTPTFRDTPSPTVRFQETPAPTEQGGTPPSLPTFGSVPTFGGGPISFPTNFGGGFAPPFGPQATNDNGDRK